MLYGWKENAMLTNCLAACANLSITISEIQRDLWKKSSFYHTPLHSTPPLGGFPSEYRHPLWDGKTRMVSLSDDEKISKISLFVLTWSTNVTDRQTDRHCVTAKTALASHRTVMMVMTVHRIYVAYYIRVHDRLCACVNFALLLLVRLCCHLNAERV